MEKVTFSIQKHYETDVLVLGGGTAGLSAAVMAARQGVRVMLCDKESCLGGMATGGLVGPFMPCYDPEGNNQLIKGFFEEFVNEMVREGGAIHPRDVSGATSYSSYRIRGHAHVTPFDCEVFKRVAEKMCLDAGVQLIYNACFQCAEMDSDRIVGAVFSGKGGMFEVHARQYIDCSGDGDLAFSAGAPFEIGKDNDGIVQPVSIFFILDGIDKAPMDQWVADHKDDYKSWFFESAVTAARERGEYNVPRHNVEMYEEVDGSWRINMARMNGVNALDPEDITRALIELRRQIPVIIHLLQTTVPGCEHAHLRVSSSVLGVRETRRIKGKFVLDAAQMHQRCQYDDTIFLAGNLVDIHANTTVYYNTVQFSGAYAVPYRVLLPQNVTNLLVAGRCISATREALGAIRVMPPCFAMGQAAGTAAALCVKDNISPEQIHIPRLQAQLRADGVLLSETDI